LTARTKGVSSKTDTKSIIGPEGVKRILERARALDENVGTVAIGGINLENVQRVIYQSSIHTGGRLGVAVVSAIMGAPDPKKVAEEFNEKISNYPAFTTFARQPASNEVQILLDAVPSVIEKVASKRPLTHCMINFVVANFAANALLAM
jgi:thiamine-phosphate diphosphorylase/hydroxyethylthiazole kinase